MNKKFGFLIFAFMLASLILSACGAAPVPESQVLCPIKYDTASGQCVFSNVVPDGDSTNQLYTSLNLAQNEAAVCQAPGPDKNLEIVTGISTHLYPDTFCWKYPVNQKILDTQQDPATACDATAAANGECIKQIFESVNLMGGAIGTVSYQIPYKIVMNSDTPQNKALLKQVGGYPALMNQFNDLTRRLFRESQSIDPQEEVAGSIRDSIAKLWTDILSNPEGEFTKWEYRSLFEVGPVVVTYSKVLGLDTASNVQMSQEDLANEAFIRQRDAFCKNYAENSSYRLECERNFVCSQDNKVCYFGGAVIPMDLTTPTPIPVEFTPTATP